MQLARKGTAQTPDSSAEGNKEMTSEPRLCLRLGDGI